MVRVLWLKYLGLILQHRRKLFWSFGRCGCSFSILLALHALVCRPFASIRRIVLLFVHLELLNQVQATVSVFSNSLIDSWSSTARLQFIFKVLIRGFVEAIQIILGQLGQMWLRLFGLFERDRFESGTVSEAKTEVNVQLRALQLRCENVGCLKVIV